MGGREGGRRREKRVNIQLTKAKEGKRDGESVVVRIEEADGGGVVVSGEEASKRLLLGLFCGRSLCPRVRVRVVKQREARESEEGWRPGRERPLIGQVD